MRPRRDRRLTLLGFAAALLWTTPAAAVDAVTGASKREQVAGTENAAIWIVGRGFAPGLTVIISGDGITEQRAPTVVAEAERIDGGRGDGIAYYFSIAPGASPGPRDITVRGADGTTATGMGLIEVIAGAAPPPDPPDAGMVPMPDPDPMPEDRPQRGKVEFISRASPEFGEQGAQVNMWIVGRSFIPGLQVQFSAPGLGPAVVEGRTIPLEVVRSAESERGMLDGIQYYLQIPADAPVGPVDITVTSPDGSMATGMGLFDILPPGEMPPPDPGAGNVDAITGASPRAGRAGRNLSLWIWGDGFATGAQVRFSSPSIRPYSEPEVVEQTTSNPGFAGVRNYLFVDEGALPGPVDVTVINPNGTQVTAEGLFEIIDSRGNPGAPGGGAGGDDGCTQPDLLTSIESVDRVVPEELARGETVNLAIQGRAFACGASVVISGGGLSAVGAPRLVRDPNDQLLTTLFWQIEVSADAPLGARDVTVINPNNTSKARIGAMRIVEQRGEGGEGGSGSGSFCQAAPGGGPGWLLLLPLLLGRRRR